MTKGAKCTTPLHCLVDQKKGSWSRDSLSQVACTAENFSPGMDKPGELFKTTTILIIALKKEKANT